MGISGSLPLTSELFPIQFLVDFQDVGVMWERGGGLIAALDTGFATTGLSVPFTQYFSEGSGMSEGLTWQDVVDGTTGIEPDSLYFVSDSAFGRMLMLPTKIQANLTWWPSPDVQVRATARAGAWMPEPELTLGCGLDSWQALGVWCGLPHRRLGRRTSGDVVGMPCDQEAHPLH